jgi:hypothetical protein
MDPTNAELKLTIAKLIEVAYSKDKGLTGKIVLSKGPFKLTMDDDGNAMLSGKAGTLSFSGAPTLEKMGLSLKRVSVNFSNEGEGRVHYVASVGIKGTTLGIAGDFNIEDLITSCSGMLCQAARSLKGFDSTVDSQMQQIMGY